MRPAVLAPPLGGLGRGLAGILGEARVDYRGDGAGLRLLLGRQPSPAPPRVRQFVTDTAMAVIAEGFEAEAVVIVRREGPGRPAEVSSRIPPSWEDGAGWTFELFGRLYRLLEDQDRGPSLSQLVQLGDRHGWLGRQESSAGDLVAAVVRAHPFSQAERETLARVVRSVGVAVGVGGAGSGPGAELSAVVAPVGAGWEAEVCVRRSGFEAGRAAATGPSRELAVARAAAQLCSRPCQVVFAGTTRLDQVAVSIVLVDDETGSPLLGLSVSDDDGTAGPAEAVLSAMSEGDDRLPADLRAARSSKR